MEEIIYKNKININMMKPIAEDLIKKYPSVLSYLEPVVDKILFIEVDSHTPDTEQIKAADVFRAVKVSKLPLQFAEIIHQESGNIYNYRIEFKSWLYEVYDSSVIIVLLYHCLRCISSDDGGIVSPDRFGWSELMENLNADWFDPNSSMCDNILDKDIFNNRRR